MRYWRLFLAESWATGYDQHLGRPKEGANESPDHICQSQPQILLSCHSQAVHQGARGCRTLKGLVFIAPVYWCHFPAIMKGWFERIFAYGDAYALTLEG